MKNNLAYLKAFLKEFHNTGTFFPSSSWLSDSLTEQINKSTEPVNILEVGSGSGAVTKEILSKMKSNDTLTICELNESFIKLLNKTLSKDKNYIEHKKNITIFHGSILDLIEENKFNYIVCSLPFINFDIKLTKLIFKKLHDLSKKDTVFSFFTYIGALTFSKILFSKKRKNLSQLQEFFKKQSHFKEIKKNHVFLNIPPATIISYTKED